MLKSILLIIYFIVLTFLLDNIFENSTLIYYETFEIIFTFNFVLICIPQQNLIQTFLVIVCILIGHILFHYPKNAQKSYT